LGYFYKLNKAQCWKERFKKGKNILGQVAEKFVLASQEVADAWPSFFEQRKKNVNEVN